MEQRITLTEAVRRRKSTRSYDMSGLTKEELSQIMEYVDSISPLLPGIKGKVELVGANDVKSMMKWRAPHYLCLYAEDSDAGLMNIGFVYEQLVLYMTTLNIGTCWATSVSPKEKHEEDGTKWATVIAFGKARGEDVLREPEQAKRKAPNEVYDKKDDALEAARLAPSSMNNQPWRFEHKGDSVLVYCKKQGLLKKWMVAQNRIDIGIALGNIKAVKDTFHFSLPDKAVEKNGYTLMGEIRFK